MSSHNFDYRSATFRQKVIMNIEDALKKSVSVMGPQRPEKSATYIEQQIFEKSASRDSYMSMVARIILRLQSGGQNQQQTAPSMNQGPMTPMMPDPNMQQPGQMMATDSNAHRTDSHLLPKMLAQPSQVASLSTPSPKISLYLPSSAPAQQVKQTKVPESRTIQVSSNTAYPSPSPVIPSPSPAGHSPAPASSLAQLSRFFATTSSSKPSGIEWLQQCVRSFITPYGAAKEAPQPEEILNTLKPFSSEWLTRPDVALSEYGDTITSNLPIIQDDSSNIIDSSFPAKLSSFFYPIMHNLDAVDKKTNSTATATDAKKVLKSLIDNDELDVLMENMFKISGAMFAMSTNYLIASSLLRHPKQFAKIVDGKSKESSNFKQGGTTKQMKDYLLSKFAKEQTASEPFSRKASPSVRRAFFDSSSSDGDDETPPLARKTLPKETKKKAAEKTQSKEDEKILEKRPEKQGNSKTLKRKATETLSSGGTRRTSNNPNVAVKPKITKSNN